MAEGGEPTPVVISLTVKNPSNHALDFSMEVPADVTVLAVKQRLQRDYVGNPDPSCQKLIVSGQIVRDEQVLRDVLSKASLSETQVVHLVIPGMQAHPPSHAQPPGPTQPATTARQLPPPSQPRVAAPESRIINPPALPTASGATPASSPSPAPLTSAPEVAPEPAGIAAATTSNFRPIAPVLSEASTPAGPVARPPPATTPQMPADSNQGGASSQGAGTSAQPAGEGAAPPEQGPGSGYPQAMSPEALHTMYMQMLVGNPMMAALPFNPALMHPALMGFPPMVPPMYPGFHPGLGLPPQYPPQPGNHSQQQPPHSGGFALPPNMPLFYGGFPYAVPLGAPLPYMVGQAGVYAQNLGGAQGVMQGTAAAGGLRQRPGQPRSGMPQPAAAAAGGAVPPGAAAAAGGAARVPGVARRRRVQIDLFLLLKLAVVVFVFNQDGSMERLFLLSIAATIVYLYQTGTLAPFLRRLARNTQRALHPAQPGQVPPVPAPPAGAGAAQAGPAGVGHPFRAPVGGQPGQGIQRGEQWQIVREVQMFLLGFLTSLFPGWQAPEEVIPRAPPEPAPVDPGQGVEEDRPHQD